MEFTELHEVKNIVENKKNTTPFDNFHKEKSIQLVYQANFLPGNEETNKEEDLDDILNDIKNQDLIDKEEVVIEKQKEPEENQKKEINKKNKEIEGPSHKRNFSEGEALKAEKNSGFLKLKGEEIANSHNDKIILPSALSKRIYSDHQDGNEKNEGKSLVKNIKVFFEDFEVYKKIKIFLFSTEQNVSFPLNLKSNVSDIKRDILYRLLLVQNTKQFLKFPFDEDSYVLGNKTAKENERGQIFDNDRKLEDYSFEDLVRKFNKKNLKMPRF